MCFTREKLLGLKTHVWQAPLVGLTNIASVENSSRLARWHRTFKIIKLFYESSEPQNLTEKKLPTRIRPWVSPARHFWGPNDQLCLNKWVRRSKSENMKKQLRMLGLWATAHNCTPIRVIKPRMLESCHDVYEVPGGEYMCSVGLCSRCIVSTWHHQIYGPG